VPQESGSSQGTVTQLASQLGLAVPNREATSSPQFYAELLQSREVLREAVTTVYDAAGGAPFHGTLMDYYGIRIPGADTGRAVVKAVKKLRKDLVVRMDRNVGIVKFQVRTEIPGLSVRVADRFIELVNTFNLERRRSQARAEREFVEQRLAQSRQDLTGAEDALASFLGRNRSIGDPQLVAQEQRLQRQVTLQQQLYLTLAQSYEMAKIEEVRNTPVITVIERPEGFVEPQGRGLVVRSLTALLVGVLLAIGLAFAGESAARSRSSGQSDYHEFVTLRGQVASGLPRWIRRSAAGREPGAS
jgi:uncharacterized protein involved in exopolysaccharide biosynthesis